MDRLKEITFEDIFQICVIVMLLAFTIVLCIVQRRRDNQKAVEDPYTSVIESLSSQLETLDMRQKELNADIVDLKEDVIMLQAAVEELKLLKQQEILEETTSVEYKLSEEEFSVLARCVQAEAGNQGVYGMELVCEVILNRVDSDTFPDNIIDVIYQSGQFEVVSNGKINTAVPTEDCLLAVTNALEHRTHKTIAYFCAGEYSDYGIPAFPYKDHYFSTE